MQLPTSYAFPGTCTFKKQVNVLENDMIYVANRIRGLEDLLDDPNIEPDLRAVTEEEILKMKEQLDKHKKTVKEFHSDKHQHVYIVTCIIFIVFIVLGMYKIFYT